MATTGLVRFDMDQGSWTNETGPDSVQRAGLSMDYIPASHGGVLIYFEGVRETQGNGSSVGQPMDEVFLYDIILGSGVHRRRQGRRRGRDRGSAWGSLGRTVSQSIICEFATLQIYRLRRSFDI